jgi:tRNA threonylcarbamoyl adenosine modification protein YeaZ
MAASLLLVLNAAEARLQTVLGEWNEETGALAFISAQERHAPSQGTELLAQLLSDQLKRAHAVPGDIARIACVSGPGSFTGLRLAIASAAGLARSIGALQGSLEYLPLLAEQACLVLAPLPPTPATFWTLTYARRQLVHAQGFYADGACSPPSPLGPPTALSLDSGTAGTPCALERHIREKSPEGALLLLGGGRTRNAGLLRRLLPDAVHLSENLDQATPMHLLAQAGRAAYSRDDLVPCYIRASDAEEQLPHIAAGLGLDPDQARRDLQRLTSARPAARA